MLKDYELIVTIVKKGQSDKVVKASREGGATGGTIIYGRGTSVYDNDTILGVTIQPEKEIIFTLVDSSQKTNIMKLICEEAGLNTSGEGIIFSLPINRILGSKKFARPEDKKDEGKK